MFRPILEMFNCTEPTFIILYSFEKEGRNVNSISIRYILYIFFSIYVRRFISNGLTIGMVPFGFCRLYSPVSPVTKFFVFVFYTIFFFSFKNPIFAYVRRLLWSGLSYRDETFLILRQQNLSSLFIVKYRYCKLHIIRRLHHITLFCAFH